MNNASMRHKHTNAAAQYPVVRGHLEHCLPNGLSHLQSMSRGFTFSTFLHNKCDILENGTQGLRQFPRETVGRK
jgi:hypothetical protein